MALFPLSSFSLPSKPPTCITTKPLIFTFKCSYSKQQPRKKQQHQPSSKNGMQKLIKTLNEADVKGVVYYAGSNSRRPLLHTLMDSVNSSTDRGQEHLKVSIGGLVVMHIGGRGAVDSNEKEKVEKVMLSVQRKTGGRGQRRGRLVVGGETKK